MLTNLSAPNPNLKNDFFQRWLMFGCEKRAQIRVQMCEHCYNSVLAWQTSKLITMTKLLASHSIHQMWLLFIISWSVSCEFYSHKTDLAYVQMPQSLSRHMFNVKYRNLCLNMGSNTFTTQKQPHQWIIMMIWVLNSFENGPNIICVDDDNNNWSISVHEPLNI